MRFVVGSVGDVYVAECKTAGLVVCRSGRHGGRYGAALQTRREFRKWEIICGICTLPSVAILLAAACLIVAVSFSPLLPIRPGQLPRPSYSAASWFFCTIDKRIDLRTPTGREWRHELAGKQYRIQGPREAISHRRTRSSQPVLSPNDSQLHGHGPDSRGGVDRRRAPAL